MQWYENGTATKYLKDQPESKKFELVMIYTLFVSSWSEYSKQVKQVAQGLKYLHVEAGQVIHGDIKGVSKTWRWLICGAEMVQE